MSDLINILNDLNNNLTNVIINLESKKTFIEFITDSGILVLLASVLTIIITNSFNKSENDKKRTFELEKLKKEFDSNIQIRREELLIEKYDSILKCFKSYRLEYHVFQNSILTVIKVGKYDPGNFSNEIIKLKENYGSFSKSHTVNIGSLKVDLSLLGLNECKNVINDIEAVMVKIFDITRLLSPDCNFTEIESQFNALNNECYENLIKYMDMFSNRYLKLYKLTENNNG